MKKLMFIVALLLINSIPLLAQDAEGCKEHPFFSRMPNFVITGCSQSFNKLEYYISDETTDTKEGELTTISYTFPDDESLKVPSQLQVIRNYENAITKLGGKKIYVGDQYLSYSLKKNSKEYIICVAMYNGNIHHQLSVLEIALMKQEITANEMLDALNKDGYIALNILFETGKSAIQQESLPIVDQIFELMKSDLTLKISIEGHTDNVGDAVSNKKLSHDRAQAVMDALIAKGVDRIRMSFVGWGQEKPVADNRSEEGRAKNRRVEIVKQP
ncbi:MAG: OmpA family protein [Bacteroidota bacterium]|jgi:outer membrane protein OmpA-like peptidoglycan-associated protein